MADREPPYDPYIPAGGAAAGGSAAPNGNQRTAALQAVSITSDHKLHFACSTWISHGHRLRDGLWKS